MKKSFIFSWLIINAFVWSPVLFSMTEPRNSPASFAERSADYKEATCNDKYDLRKELEEEEKKFIHHAAIATISFNSMKFLNKKFICTRCACSCIATMSTIFALMVANNIKIIQDDWSYLKKG